MYYGEARNCECNGAGLSEPHSEREALARDGIEEGATFVENVRNIAVRTACETCTDSVHLRLGTILLFIHLDTYRQTTKTMWLPESRACRSLFDIA